MARIVESNSVLNNIGNILWLNIKRFKSLLIWRVIFIAINFLLYFSATMLVSTNVNHFILVIVTLSNLLFIYTRIRNESESITLLRALGSSRIFIILDHFFEFIMQIIIAFILFLPVLIFRKGVYPVLILFAFQFIAISFIAPLYTIYYISELEKQNKE